MSIQTETWFFRHIKIANWGANWRMRWAPQLVSTEFHCRRVFATFLCSWRPRLVPLQVSVSHSGDWEQMLKVKRRRRPCKWEMGKFIFLLSINVVVSIGTLETLGFFSDVQCVWCNYTCKNRVGFFFGGKCRYVNLPGIKGVVGFHVLLDPDKTQNLSPNSQTSHVRPNLGLNWRQTFRLIPMAPCARGCSRNLCNLSKWLHVWIMTHAITRV